MMTFACNARITDMTHVHDPAIMKQHGERQLQTYMGLGRACTPGGKNREIAEMEMYFQ